jgi:hypothetical protein
MKTYSIDTPDAGRVTYTDHQCGWWMLSLASWLIPLVCIAGYGLTGSQLRITCLLGARAIRRLCCLLFTPNVAVGDLAHMRDTNK